MRDRLWQNAGGRRVRRVDSVGHIDEDERKAMLVTEERPHPWQHLLKAVDHEDEDEYSVMEEASGEFESETAGTRIIRKMCLMTFTLSR